MILTILFLQWKQAKESNTCNNCITTDRYVGKNMLAHVDCEVKAGKANWKDSEKLSFYDFV